MKRKTTRSHRRKHMQVLEVRVTSPRILWFGFLRGCFRFSKIAIVVGILALAGFGIWRGVQQTFHKNPEFRLSMIDLNENPVLDGIEFAQVAGIDLTNPPVLFDVDVRRAREILASYPGIASASVERHLPGKLVVRVVPRVAKAWISWSAGGFPGEPRTSAGYLIDSTGMPFPCPPTMLESAKELPVLKLAAAPETLAAPGTPVTGAEIERCFRLLDSAIRADADAPGRIDSIRQANAWSMELVTRDGVAATFSLGDHDQQIARFRAAQDHAGAKGMHLATINLIPKHNIPFTLRGDAPVAIPVSAAAPAPSRRDRDVNSLLNRN